MLQPTITFIGAGHMAESLIHGLIANGYPKEAIWAANRSIERLDLMRQKYQIHTTQNNAEGAKHAEVLLLAVKPQDTATALQSLKIKVKKQKPLVISVITGWTVERIQEYLEYEEPAVVRCVPNTPALVGSGAIGLYANNYCTQKQKNLAESILRSVGVTLWVKQENLMNVVTGLSGSGPAYFYAIMEALEQAGVHFGLSKETAKLLTLQTAFGAAKMALESNTEISALREQVTSKGGTTEQALKVLKEKNIAEILEKAVEAAYKRAKELSEN